MYSMKLGMVELILYQTCMSFVTYASHDGCEKATLIFLVCQGVLRIKRYNITYTNILCWMYKHVGCRTGWI